MLRMSASTDSSTSGAGGKSVEKSSKSSKSLKGLKNLQRPSVWGNVYRSNDPPSIEELELSLEF